MARKMMVLLGHVLLMVALMARCLGAKSTDTTVPITSSTTTESITTIASETIASNTTTALESINQTVASESTASNTSTASESITTTASDSITTSSESNTTKVSGSNTTQLVSTVLSITNTQSMGNETTDEATTLTVTSTTTQTTTTTPPNSTPVDISNEKIAIPVVFTNIDSSGCATERESFQKQLTDGLTSTPNATVTCEDCSASTDSLMCKVEYPAVTLIENNNRNSTFTTELGNVIREAAKNVTFTNGTSASVDDDKLNIALGVAGQIVNDPCGEFCNATQRCRSNSLYAGSALACESKCALFLEDDCKGGQGTCTLDYEKNEPFCKCNADHIYLFKTCVNQWYIVGGVAGLVVLLIIIIIVVAVCCRRRSPPKQSEEERSLRHERDLKSYDNNGYTSHPTESYEMEKPNYVQPTYDDNLPAQNVRNERMATPADNTYTELQNTDAYKNFFPQLEHVDPTVDYSIKRPTFRHNDYQYDRK
ncbi:unnamed protein product [Owenia fusiformis]|uniref:Uncharacterized protein n=1 Tax=Owenia fusiformis TaxID=6347 RepID=A0A8J1TRQ7_OWEFU|nr:unnamed protein product [Owenia fusiformis]